MRSVMVMFAVAVAAPMAAQAPLPPTTPRFVEITRLAQEGYGDSARAVIARILAQTKPTDAAFAEALYTSAAVAKTLGEARLQYARISVDHADSPWADKATLRLAQLDYGSGNSESAVLRVKRIFTDFPESAVIPVAALFGARAAFERRDGALACDWLTRGLQQVGSDLELKNQLEYAKQRCTPDELARLAALPKGDSLKRPEVMPPKNPTVTPPTTTITPPSAPAATTGKATASPWRVQVAAISDPASIRRASQQIEKAGYMVYRVAGPGNLTKLQAGPFATREAAVAAVGKLKAAVGGAPFVVKAP
ncbi:MAG: SPOR domain-containing protein [Gemmatimonadales bacterium]